MRAWSQLTEAVPEQNARPHSGSYSRMFCGGALKAGGGVPGFLTAMPRCAVSIQGGVSAVIAACMPVQSPIVHWSPSHLFHSANIGPRPCRMHCPHAGVTSAENSGASSTSAPRTWPGLAKAASHAASRPPEEFPLAITGAPMTRSRNRTKSLPMLSRV